MKEKFNKLFLIFYAWSLGLLGRFIFLFLRILKRIEIEGYEKWKSIPLLMKKGLHLLVVSNHPSLWEPMILPILFSRWYLFFPKMLPFSTPDRKNYYDKWWYFFLRAVSIPVVREEEKRKEKRKSLKKLLQKIRERKIIILFPEGGRTFKGEEFKIIKNDGEIIIERGDWQKIEEKFPGMPKIRRFQRGVEGLLNRVQIILPVWIEIWREVKIIKIRIGEPKEAEEISGIEALEEILLKCSILK